jgi:uncharacterized protein (TIGR02145 family)
MKMKKTLLLFALFALLTIKTPAQTATDIDGNIYHTVTIGTQVWMVENLKVTHYRNGDPITNITNDNQWFNLTTPAYCDYENSPANSIIYGRIYNYFAVEDGRKIAPAGWHVPTDAEWTTLTDYLINNGFGYYGSGPTIAKSMAAKSGWTTSAQAGTVGNDQASNNSSGFSALPGGGRFTSGGFFNVGSETYWWSSTLNDPLAGLSRSIYSAGSACGRGFYDKVRGLSVRCISDLGVPTNVNKNEIENGFRIYPNPAKEKIFVTISEKGAVNIIIFNLDGVSVLRKELSTGSNEIDISSLSKGNYMVKVSGVGWTVHRKLIKI